MFGRTSTSRKADDSPVTEADHAVQEALLNAIAQHWPDDAVVTEETQAAPDRHGEAGSAKRCWVIDPIDGTRNYARSVPLFSVSVGVIENGRPVVGVIHDPNSKDTYSASRGGGLWFNDVQVSRETRAAREASRDVLIGSPTGQHHDLPAVVHDWFDRYNIRNVGSTALHLAYLAVGGFDAAILSNCHLWDIAAGWLLCEEAGVVVRTLDGSTVFPADPAEAAARRYSYLAARPAMLGKLWGELEANR